MCRFMPETLKRKIWKEKYEPLLKYLKKWREERDEKTKNSHS